MGIPLETLIGSRAASQSAQAVGPLRTLRNTEDYDFSEIETSVHRGRVPPREPLFPTLRDTYMFPF